MVLCERVSVFLCLSRDVCVVLIVYVLLWMCHIKYNVCVCVFQDIRNQRRYRQRRKAELVKLQQTNTALNSKTAFYNVQIDYYNQYIKTCMDNLASNKGK